jgi:hypothetical protein
MWFASHRLWIAALIVAGIAVACGSTKKIDPGETCTLNSDCVSPLICSMGTCHQACRETRDCLAGQSCVMVEAAGVCQLQSEADCTSRECGSGFVCAVDKRCRSGCVSEANCSQGQLCVNSLCEDPPQLADAAPSSDPEQQGNLDAGSPADASTEPRITSFVAGTNSVQPGHPTTLTATFVNGTGVITPGIGEVESGTMVSSGNIDASTTFTLTVTGSAGQTAKASLSITVLTPPQLVAASSNLIQSMITDGNNVYFFDGTIFKVAITGGTPVPLVSGLNGMLALATDGTNVYWTEYNKGKVSKVSVGGNGQATLATGQYFANSIAVYGGSVYWTTESHLTSPPDGGTEYLTAPADYTGTVMKTSIAGDTQPVTLASDQGKPKAIAVFDNTVYWLVSSPDLGGALSAVSTDGGAKAKTLVVGIGYPSNIVADGRGVHWLNDQNLMRLPLAGTSPKPLQTVVGYGNSLAIDADSAYWVSGLSPVRVQKVALDGNAAAVTLAAMNSTAYNPILTLDATSIYLTVLPGGIYRLPK